MDAMVLATQKWLNHTYGGDIRYNPVEENGKTGWPTIYALTRALQIELGILSTADNFGPTSRELYGKNPLRRVDGLHSNKFAILQGALWCKGYDPGHYASENPYGYVSDVFDESVEYAVKLLKMDAGLNDFTGTVTTNLMAALLSMDQFRLLSDYGGDSNIRVFQQEMNRKYEDYIGLMPCDGIYGRNTNIALIYALQAEEGLPTDVANGNFGPSTQTHCPTIPYNGDEVDYDGKSYGYSQILQFTKILKFGLYVNGFGNGVFTGTLMSDVVTAFQNHHALPATGIADLDTWMSVMISCGNPERKGTACDTRFEITNEALSTLKANNYQYVGRYLTGGDFKVIRPGELQRIFAGGLSVFPIYQTYGMDADYFTGSQGVADALMAEEAAKNYGVPSGTTIYFAADFDALDYDITYNILPYFESVCATLQSYRVGIYGTRNVCSRVSNACNITTSFVSDMSTGYSGNLGFPMPDNWAFDQIDNLYLYHEDNSLEIDNDICSGRDHGFNTVEFNKGYKPAPSVEDLPSNGNVLINESDFEIPVYEKTIPSQNHTGGITAGGEKVGLILPHDIYSRENEKSNFTFYSVLFYDKNSNSVKKGYIETAVGTGVMHPWKDQQMLFYISTGIDDGTRSTERIEGKTCSIFSTRCELDRLNTNGVKIATIPAATRLGTDGAPSCGKGNPNFMYVEYLYDEKLGKWVGAGGREYLSTGGYVDHPAWIDIGYQHGASPTERAIL